MNENSKRIKQINTENKIWIIYLGIIGLSLYSNYFEKRYFLCNDLYAKKKYREILIFIFVVLVIVYLYFFLDSYNEVKELKPYDSKKKKDLSELSLLGSSLILLSGIIFLYIAIVDTDINVELAFN